MKELNMYKVLRRFTDLQDNRYLYQPGDEYPRAGLDVSEDRIDELSSSNNRRHVALIKFVPQEVDTAEEVEEIEQTEPEHIENVPETSSEDPEEAEVIETKPKRKRAKKEQ
jgi:hypothetical protein